MNRRLISIVAVCLFTQAAVAQAQSSSRSQYWQQRGRQPSNASRNLPPSKQSEQAAAQQVAAANQAAAREEAKIAGQTRWLEQQTQREQQLLEGRMKQAEQVRQQGLKREDSQMLRRAEQIERQAIAHYEQRLKQLESAQIGTAAAAQNGTRQPARSTQPTNNRNNRNNRNWNSRSR